MNKFKLNSQMFSVFFICLWLAISTVAQTNKGSISGTVTDPQGAAIPGVSVTITNAGTNQTVKLTTSDNGTFSASLLDPVIYTISAEAKGFKKAIVQNIKVDTASSTSANIILEVGSEINTVTVEADAPLINAEDGAAGSVINNRQIVDLPLGDRFVLGLALTIPNVSGQTTTEEVGLFQTSVAPGAGLNVNGSRPGETTFLADGANNTGVGVARAVVNFSPDTVQEFKVSTSNFSAEYGGTGGGIVNVTTKSGTNNAAPFRMRQFAVNHFCAKQTAQLRLADPFICQVLAKADQNCITAKIAHFSLSRMNRNGGLTSYCKVL
jgi:hypothetical protein